jgi:hypothetical protein
MTDFRITFAMGVSSLATGCQVQQGEGHLCRNPTEYWECGKDYVEIFRLSVFFRIDTNTGTD